MRGKKRNDPNPWPSKVVEYKPPLEPERVSWEVAGRGEIERTEEPSLPDPDVGPSQSIPRALGVTEEDVIDWWEAFDHGASIYTIADRTRTDARVVEVTLREAGVIDEWRDKLIERGVHPARAMRILRGDVTPRERSIMLAMSRVVSFEEAREKDLSDVMHGDYSPRRGKSLHVMSARQRAQDKMRDGAVTAGLVAAGLLDRPAMRVRHNWA